MSALIDEIASRAQACAVDICWRLWRSLAGYGLAASARPVASIIDPEALVLLSLTLRGAERRLEDQLRWWARIGATLMSVQRVRTLSVNYPEGTRQAVGWFASLAFAAGDRRWRSVMADEVGDPLEVREKGPSELHLLEPSTLMVRLRAGFGVGAKADLLSFLIGGTLGEPAMGATAEVVSEAISYSTASVRRAAGEMVLARLVEASVGRPVRFAVDGRAWASLLRLQDPYGSERAGEKSVIPAWRFWAQLNAFLAACLDWAARHRVSDAAPVVQASEARDIAERFRRVLAWNGVEWVDPRLHPGERYLEGFRELVDHVADCVRREA